MCPWIASLPEHVHLPLFYYSHTDLEACQDEDVIREALSIRQSAQAVYEVQGSPLLMADRAQQSCLLHVQRIFQEAQEHLTAVALCAWPDRHLARPT